MQYDEVYRPDKLIRDIYKKDWEAKHIEEQGLPPYARIGSLAEVPTIRVRYSKYPTRTLNFHKFTLVTPLAGENLSPFGRNLYHAPLITGSYKKITRTTNVHLESSGREKIRKKRPIVWQSTILLPLITLASVGLIIYAAVFQPQPTHKKAYPSSPKQQSVTTSPYSPPSILDNNSPYPLETMLQGVSGETNTSTTPIVTNSGSYYQPAQSLSGQFTTLQPINDSTSISPSNTANDPTNTPLGK